MKDDKVDKVDEKFINAVKKAIKNNPNNIAMVGGEAHKAPSRYKKNNGQYYTEKQFLDTFDKYKDEFIKML